MEGNKYYFSSTSASLDVWYCTCCMVLYMYLHTPCLRLKFKKGSQKNTLQSEILGGGGGE